MKAPRHYRLNVSQLLSGKSPGQMTIEFALMFPTIIIVALITINGLLFFGLCSSFDRQFNQAALTYLTSPASNQQNTQSLLLNDLEERFPQDYTSVTVSSEAIATGLTRVHGQLEFYPTLFGYGPLKSAFGVSFPTLTHHQSLVVDAYKPGVLL